ncbi:hypothetical protein ERJ75_001203100 [Trypanosoma vivax]|nr:hypothetical protein ERJ75_001203100 [Trypanosoma vivax]
MRHWAAIGAALAALAATLRGADASAAQKGALVVTGGAEHMCTLSATLKKIKRDALATRGRLPRVAEGGNEGARSGTSRADIELALANATQLAAQHAPGTGGKLTRAQSLRAALRAWRAPLKGTPQWTHGTAGGGTRRNMVQPIDDTIEAFETASTTASVDSCASSSQLKQRQASATRADQEKLYGCIREDAANKNNLDTAISKVKEATPLEALRAATQSMKAWTGGGSSAGEQVFDAGTSSAGVCTFTEKGTTGTSAGLKADVHTAFAGLWTLTLNSNNPTIAWKGGDLGTSAKTTKFAGIIDAWDALQAHATIESQMCDTSTLTKDVQLIMDKLCSDEEEEDKRKHIAALVQLAAKVTQQAAEESKNQTPQQSGEKQGHKTPGHEDTKEQRATEAQQRERNTAERARARQERSGALEGRTLCGSDRGACKKGRVKRRHASAMA